MDIENTVKQGKINFFIQRKESYLTLWATLPDKLRTNGLVMHIFDEIENLDDEVRLLGCESTVPFGSELKKFNHKKLDEIIRVFRRNEAVRYETNKFTDGSEYNVSMNTKALKEAPDQ